MRAATVYHTSDTELTSTLIFRGRKAGTGGRSARFAA
jgi:hypothetical protein